MTVRADEFRDPNPGRGPIAAHPARPRRPLPTLYVSGPMTGLVDFNRHAFMTAAHELRTVGYAVRSPLETQATLPNGDLRPYGDLLRDDLRIVLDADAIAVLPGWESSTGARAEVQLGLSLQMPVRSLDEWIVARHRGPVLEALGIALSMGDDPDELAAWRRLRAVYESAGEAERAS